MQQSTDLNINASVAITLEESALGCEKSVSIIRNECCTKCNGSGHSNPNIQKKCPYCDGTGKKIHTDPFLKMIDRDSPCDRCGGTGSIKYRKTFFGCDICSGSGFTSHQRDVQVKIPVGIDNNQTIALRGEGNVGKDGQKGDLLIHVSLLRHSIFERSGSNILYKHSISPDFAASGGRVDVPTLYGNVSFSIPANTKTDNVYRLKGMGIQSLNSSKKGDQYVSIIINASRPVEQMRPSSEYSFKWPQTKSAVSKSKREAPFLPSDYISFIDSIYCVLLERPEFVQDCKKMSSALADILPGKPLETNLLRFLIDRGIFSSIDKANTLDNYLLNKYTFLLEQSYGTAHDLAQKMVLILFYSYGEKILHKTLIFD